VTAITPRKRRAAAGDPDIRMRDCVAGISHELRSPLACIIGWTDALTDGLIGPVSPDQAEILDLIGQNGRRVVSLVDDLVLLTGIETGITLPRLVDTDMADLVTTIVRDEIPESVRGSRTIDVDLPAAGLSAIVDRDLYTRAVSNLLSNATRFTPAGGCVSIRLRVADGLVELAVTDTGVGIDSPAAGRLFERFIHTEPVSGEGGRGNGLGLAICRAIAEAHGGRVTATSVLGRGSCFTILLPALADRPITEDSS
jgi:signal transduction histidine kinase